MNLHAIVSPYIGAVNPPVTVTLQRSTGSTTAPDGTRVPTYAQSINCKAQIQALTYNDLVQIDGLNIQGMRRAIYLFGEWDGLVRVDHKGGDLITFPNGDVYLVAMVLEVWPGWCKVVATLQDGA